MRVALPALAAAFAAAVSLHIVDARAQQTHDHMDPDMQGMPGMQGGHDEEQPAPAEHGRHHHGAAKSGAKSKPQAKHKHPQSHAHGAPGNAPPHDHGGDGGMIGMQHGGMARMEHSDHAMRGFLGAYDMSREGSGTSWLPDSTPHEGVHAMAGDWSTMWHALINVAYDHQGGPRGGDKTFTSGMVMGMAQRTLGDGTFGLRAMLSPDPFMGTNGYPLLLATGETANGRTPLIDRQHSHDVFMELATTYSHPISTNSSLFLYAGLPGEPALGPPAFMHRTSGMDIPEAPITHHWLDSTHITFGVVTGGVVLNTWKLEASAFRGREPDQYRYDIEAPKLDSFSGRVTWNPIRELSLQASWGRLQSPEQLEPEVNEDRFTTSAIYTQPFGNDNLWSTTLAWGRKMNHPGHTLDGLIMESAVILQKTYTLFMRGERVQEDELSESRAVYTVSKASFGGIWDFYRTDHIKIGVGGLVSVYGLPGDIQPTYGSPTSGMIFGRIKVQ
jgi:hypothetical protein